MILWVKAFHVISVISWMAAMLYLPRLLVYHCGAQTGTELSETLKVMERRLLKIIMTPAMIGTWVFGLWAAFLFDVWAEPWFLLKFALVVAMTGYHGAISKWVKTFAVDQNLKSPKFYRIANEGPAVLMIIIVILVIVKPF